MKIQSSRIAAIALFCAALPSCGLVPQPTAADFAAAEYGSPPPPAERDRIRAWLLASLRDPDSARIEISEPHHAWWQRWWTQYYGWRIVYEWNAKNGFGGYAGWKSDAIYYRDGEIETRYMIKRGAR